MIQRRLSLPGYPGGFYGLWWSRRCRDSIEKLLQHAAVREVGGTFLGRGTAPRTA